LQARAQERVAGGHRRRVAYSSSKAEAPSLKVFPLAVFGLEADIGALPD
jgi:hypothetical protein